MGEKTNLEDVITEIKGVEAFVEYSHQLISLLPDKRFIRGREDFINYLEGRGYFTDPASARYHSNFKHGLVFHSCLVFLNLLVKKVRDLGLDSIIISSLFHDLCKVGTYIGEKRWRKDDGKWVSYPIISYTDDPSLGHGEKSAILLQHYMNLRPVELYMIRWHMGFSEPKESWGYMRNSIDQFPAIAALIAADIEAAFIDEPQRLKDKDFSFPYNKFKT